MPTETNQTDWTLKRLLTWTTEYFQQARVDQPRLCAEILLAHVLRCERIDLYVRFDQSPTPDQLTTYKDLVRRCRLHEPVAYLTGHAHFYGLTLKVAPGVLIPRPETELLVTQALNFIQRQSSRPIVDVLDLCTGSGCIAIALATHAVEAEIVAVDRNPAALAIARENIETLGLEGRITLHENDLFADLDKTGKGLFDLIVSNPPYISDREFQTLDPTVRDYEPKEALLSGPDGLDCLRRIIDNAEPYLADEGALMVEIAYNQADEVIALFEKTGYLTDIEAVTDHQGHRRVIKARKT